MSLPAENPPTSTLAQKGPDGSLLYLLYHELTREPGVYRYALSTATFAGHLELFERLRREYPQGVQPEVTFDDGHVSHFAEALPALQRFGVSAQFFITAGWTSKRPEYMTWDQLRELANAGQKIGAHGWSHKLLTHCSRAELEIELDDARRLLEDKLGLPVTTMSLPGGRSNRQVLEACTRAGYTQVFTSVPRLEISAAVPVAGRLNLRSTATVASLETLLTSSGTAMQRLERRHRLKETAQRALGDTLYAKLWALLNRAQEPTT